MLLSRSPDGEMIWAFAYPGAGHSHLETTAPVQLIVITNLLSNDVSVVDRAERSSPAGSVMRVPVGPAREGTVGQCGAHGDDWAGGTRQAACQRRGEPLDGH